MSYVPEEVVRATNDEATYKALVDLLVGHMYPEAGDAPIDHEKTLDGIFDCLSNGIVFNALAYPDRRIVGSVGVVAVEGWWYSKQVGLFDRWFYVLPEWRGVVGARLARALTLTADGLNMKAYIADANPSRSRRGRVASINGFQPAGRIIRLNGG
jgi:hypothetical protein